MIHNFKNFKIYLVVECGIGTRCANDYLGAVRRFTEKIGTYNPSQNDMRKYLMYFHEKGYSYSHTVNTMLALEHYSRFTKKAITFQRPRKPKTRVEDWLTEQEVGRILVSCKNIREKTLIALLAYTGIRNQELCNLKVKNINFLEGTIFIKAGKGLKDGVVCISPFAIKVIKKYLSTYPRSTEDYIFSNIEGSHTGLKLKTGTIRKYVKKISRKAGIQRRVYPHLFRHSLAMNMLLRGCDVFSVKEQMRHEYLSTTEIYIKSNPQILKNNYQVFVPQYTWGDCFII